MAHNACVHEMSIAMSLVEIAAEEAARLHAGRILKVHVRVGRLSGVVPEALTFAFDAASAGGALDGAELVIEDVPASIYCDICDATRELPSVQHLRCPVCDAPALQVTAGRELQISALEVDDHVAAHR